MRLLAIPIIALLFTSCANIIPPTGGPKDTIPPTLIKSVPIDEQTNFKNQEIILDFDEPIQLKNAKEEIIITPALSQEPEYLFRKNQVLIKTKVPFGKDTTYSIAFRQSIQDLNEGNPAEDLRLAFSTGSLIDSLSISGRVKTAAEAKPGEKFTVAIYQQDTFDIFKHKPVYVTRANKLGRFTIRNLKPGTYKVYAFYDKNKNLKIDSQSESFGTAAMPVTLPEFKDSLNINVIRLDMRPIKLNSSRGVANTATIRLNKAPKTYRLSALNKGDYVLSHYNTTRSEITAYPPKTWPDSTSVRLTAQDSAGSLIDTVFYIKQTKQKPIKESFKAAFRSINYINAIKKLDTDLTMTLPAGHINTDSILLLNDTIPLRSLNRSSLVYDTTNLKITIREDLNLPDSLVKKKLNLSFRKGWLISIYNDTLKTTDQRVTVKSQETLGSIALTVKTSQENIVLQLLNEKYEVLESQPLSKLNTFKNLDPLPTIIRAFRDDNKNGKWDYGNPKLNIQPEPVWIYEDKDNKRPVPLRANWFVETEWNLK